MSNMEMTSNVIVEKCCLFNEIQELRNIISQQTSEIGRVIKERDEYKINYESLLMSLNPLTSNIIENTSNI